MQDAKRGGIRIRVQETEKGGGPTRRENMYLEQTDQKHRIKQMCAAHLTDVS